jgi:hypothetical protein
VSYTPDDIEADEEAIPETVNEPEPGVDAALASLERGSRHTSSPPQSSEPDREPDPARKERIRRSVSLSLPIISGMFQGWNEILKVTRHNEADETLLNRTIRPYQCI